MNHEFDKYNKKMMINIKLNIDKKSKNQIIPQTNNFFL